MPIEKDKTKAMINISCHKKVLLAGMLIVAVCCPTNAQRITTWKDAEATLEVATVLAGMKRLSLKQTDYLFDGGSLTYRFKDDRHRDIHLVLPNPGALAEDVRVTKVQPVLLSLSKELKSYGVIDRKGKEATRLLELISECRDKIEETSSESRKARRVLDDLIATMKSRTPISGDDIELSEFLVNLP